MPKVIEVSDEELVLIILAIDSHMYWQLADRNNRDSGEVRYPEATKELREAGALMSRLEDIHNGTVPTVGNE